MASVRVRVLGCGDAFASGGRMQTCFYLDGDTQPLLVDCGATALVALKRARIDPASVGHVVISHLHGDHFGGLPWLILDGRASKRTRALEIAGPSTTRERLADALEALYPGASAAESPFEVRFTELSPTTPVAVGAGAVTPFEVIHNSGAPSYALRVTYGDKVITYSGDTEWTDTLAEAVRGADLFICECNHYDERVSGHLDYRTLTKKRGQLQCRRLVLTHMGDEMLAHLGELDAEAASDGMTIEV